LALSALAGAILGISGFLGDITLSAVKRDLGVKDTGGLIPGHGGILDRVDSLTYAAPAFVHFIRYFFYPCSLVLVPFNVIVSVGEPVYGTDSCSEFVSKLQKAMTDLAAAEKLPVWE
jgi:hypothetical protein